MIQGSKGLLRSARQPQRSSFVRNRPCRRVRHAMWSFSPTIAAPSVQYNVAQMPFSAQKMDETTVEGSGRRRSRPGRTVRSSHPQYVSMPTGLAASNSHRRRRYHAWDRYMIAFLELAGCKSLQKKVDKNRKGSDNDLRVRTRSIMFTITVCTTEPDGKPDHAGICSGSERARRK